VLILLDKTAQQLRIASAKTASNCSGLGLHLDHEEIRRGVHATGYTGEHLKKMQGAVAGPSETFHARAS